ncbi:MAG: NAD-dependent epimerase/dehydratase family protein [bacterium]
MILVTGASGLVGSHLLYHLTQESSQIKAIYRTEKKKEYVKKVFSYYSSDVDTSFNKITWVQGDITDIPFLEEIMKDVSEVYHCAALVSFDPSRYRELRRVNIRGTANIVNVSLLYDIKKVVYVSSVAAIGKAKDNLPSNEESPWNQDGDHSVYAITKYGAELEVWRGIQEGLNAVIVNPGVILGEGFWRSGGSSALFRKVHKGMSQYTSGSTGFIDVKDVVKTTIFLMNSTISGERYILVSENVPFYDFFSEIGKVLGVKSPNKEVGKSILNIAWRLDWLRSKIFRKHRRLTKQLAASLTTKENYDNGKIKKLVDFEFVAVKDSIKRVATAFSQDLA